MSDAAKASLSWKSRALISQISEKERLTSVSSYLKLEKEEQIKLQISRRKDVINRAKINTLQIGTREKKQ